MGSGHACQPRSHCRGRAWAAADGVSNPSSLPEGGKTRPVSRRVARVTFLAAAALAGAVCWELGAGAAPLSLHRDAPVRGHPAAWDRRPRDAGGSQAQGWGDSGTLEEPRRDEKCQSFAGAGSLRGRRAFLAGAWEVWAASCRATKGAPLVSIWSAFERAASIGSVGVPPPAAGSVCLLGKR